MFSYLKKHPFAVEAFFKSSIVLTFAVEKERIQNIIPKCLELDVFQDKWAFVAVAMVQTKDLRPKGFPKVFGNDFFLIGYRIFVRYTTETGKKLRGLYILRSETDKLKMKFFGNIFTNYNYSQTDIQQTQSYGLHEISSQGSGIKLVVNIENESTELPKNSPFADFKEARRFAGPLPFTFTFNEDTNEVLIIEGVREHWIPKPVNVIEYKFPFLKTINVEDATLANAFIIQDIPYYWKKGKMEQWKP